VSIPRWRPPLLIILILLLAFTCLCASSPGKVPSCCSIHYPSDSKVEWECRRVRAGETLESLFGDRWIDVARFNRIDRRHVRPGTYLKVPKRLEDIKDFTPMPSYYSQVSNEEKIILVDQPEQFIGAYEYGRLMFSAPITTGEKNNMTPSGEFRISATRREHRSSLYFIEGTHIPYPMNYGLIFHTSKAGVMFAIHGRDLPGYPASHGCIGLYDEAMQKKYYGYPRDPKLEDAKKLYEWVMSGYPDTQRSRILEAGPKVVIK